MPGLNPYTPGAGDRPRALIGRQSQLALAQVLQRQVEAGYAANSLIFTGLRGVGKTVLLKEIADRLVAAGWHAPYLELRRDLPIDAAFGRASEQVGRSLPPKSRLWRAWHELSRRGGGVTVMGSGATVSAAPRSSDGYGDLRDTLEYLAGAARADGAGVALIVDELQTMRAQHLGGLVHLVQDLRDRLPFALIGAGLPYLPSYISRAATYTERLRYEPTDYLAPIDARAAVRQPAEAEGGGWQEEALERLVGLADGYPHFLQLYAFEAWEAAGVRSGPVEVSAADLAAAEPTVRRQIEAGIFAARFEGLGRSAKRYLYAMLRLSAVGDRRGRARSGAVAKELGVSLFAASPTRDGLIRRGIIHAPEHGVVEYSVPGFAEYLERRALDEGEP